MVRLGIPEYQPLAHGRAFGAVGSEKTDAARGIAKRSTTKRGEREAGNRSAS